RKLGVDAQPAAFCPGWLLALGDGGGGSAAADLRPRVCLGSGARSGLEAAAIHLRHVLRGARSAVVHPWLGKGIAASAGGFALQQYWGGASQGDVRGPRAVVRHPT